MKFLATLCLIAVVAAAPLSSSNYEPSQLVAVLRFNNDNIGSGNYRYGFEQTDGQKVDQQGEIINEGREDEHLSVKGSYSWVAPNGVKYTVTYVADDQGFQPEIEEGPGTSPGVVASLLG